jgi:hypothetical protein
MGLENAMPCAALAVAGLGGAAVLTVASPPAAHCAGSGPRFHSQAQYSSLAESGATPPPTRIADVAHNATVPPDTSVTFGFQATRTDNTDEPSSFSAFGGECAVE